MHFNLVDAVVERTRARIVTVKQVSLAEEYLQDHFASFPVLPGVMMIEAVVQAARLLLEDRVPGGRLVLGGARGVKYGRFVRPGDALRVEVELHKELEGGSFEVKAEGTVVSAWKPDASGAAVGGAAISGRLTLRPVRLGVQD